VTRDEVVADARQWLGTPFMHQERVLGHGGDCVAMAEWLALRYHLIEKPFRTNYGPEPNMREIIQGMKAAGLEKLRSIDDRLPADILFIQWAKEPQHLGLLLPGNRIIHGYSTSGKYVESNLNGRLLDGLRSVWRFPGIV